MPYQIFVSHVGADRRIAEAVKSILNNAFAGDVGIYLAAHELGAGDEWKQELKKNLKGCSALLSIITESSLNKPWILIEWSAFWLAGKKYYSLLGGAIEVSHLIEPMKDRQAVKMTNTDEVKRFFRNLAKDSGHKEVPYQFVDSFVEEVLFAEELKHQELTALTFERYRKKPRVLPASDEEKRNIAEYFYRNDGHDVFLEIIDEIRDNAIKAKLAIHLIDNGDMSNARLVTRAIYYVDALRDIAVGLVDRGLLDVPLLRELVEELASKNQAELRKITLRLAELGQDDSSVFHYALDNMTNLAELRKVLIYFIQNRRVDTPMFQELIESFESNRAELRKIASELMVNGMEDTKQFDHIVKLLAAGNQKEAEKVLRDLSERRPELFHKYLEQGLITNLESLERLRLVERSLRE